MLVDVRHGCLEAGEGAGEALAGGVDLHPGAVVGEAGAELAVAAQGADGEHAVLPAGQVGVGGGPEGSGAAVVAGGGDEQGALLAQFPHEVLDAEQAVGAAVGGAGGEAEDVGPAAGVDGLEEPLAELGLQHGAGVVEGAADGDVGVGRDGGDQPGDERAVPDVLLEDALFVALLDLGVAAGVGQQAAGAVVVREAGVDDEHADGGVRVVGRVGCGRVGWLAERDRDGFVAGAGVDRDVHHVVAGDHPVSRPGLLFPYGPQGVRDGAVGVAAALAGVADADPGDAAAVGPRPGPADLLLVEVGCRREVRPYRVLDDLGLLAVADEDDALLVEELGGVVRAHGEGHVRHRALDLVELLVESLRCHGGSSQWGDGVGRCRGAVVDSLRQESLCGLLIQRHPRVVRFAGHYHPRSDSGKRVGYGTAADGVRRPGRGSREGPGAARRRPLPAGRLRGASGDRHLAAGLRRSAARAEPSAAGPGVRGARGLGGPGGGRAGHAGGGAGARGPHPGGPGGVRAGRRTGRRAHAGAGAVPAGVRVVGARSPSRGAGGRTTCGAGAAAGGGRDLDGAGADPAGHRASGAGCGGAGGGGLHRGRGAVGHHRPGARQGGRGGEPGPGRVPVRGRAGGAAAAGRGGGAVRPAGHADVHAEHPALRGADGGRAGARGAGRGGRGDQEAGRDRRAVHPQGRVAAGRRAGRPPGRGPAHGDRAGRPRGTAVRGAAAHVVGGARPAGADRGAARCRARLGAAGRGRRRGGREAGVLRCSGRAGGVAAGGPDRAGPGLDGGRGAALGRRRAQPAQRPAAGAADGLVGAGAAGAGRRVDPGCPGGLPARSGRARRPPDDTGRLGIAGPRHRTGRGTGGVGAAGQSGVGRAAAAAGVERALAGHRAVGPADPAARRPGAAQRHDRLPGDRLAGGGGPDGGPAGSGAGA